MLKIFLFSILFFAGVALGGGVRYAQVEAQLSDVEIQPNIIAPTSASPMGAAAAGSCG